LTGNLGRGPGALRRAAANWHAVAAVALWVLNEADAWCPTLSEREGRVIGGGAIVLTLWALLRRPALRPGERIITDDEAAGMLAAAEAALAYRQDDSRGERPFRSAV